MNTRPAISDRQRICLSCREKSCCSYYTVTVTAHDVLRVCRAMQTSPGDFLTYYATESTKGSFILAPEGCPYTLALKRREMPDNHASPCIFLLRTNDAHAVCGLGDLRPSQCRTFPTYLASGFVGIIHRPEGCVRAWSFAEVQREPDRHELRRALSEQTAHAALSEAWNERVRVGGMARTFDEFCAFLINHVEEPEVTS